MVNIFWFRRDLRLEDNTGLYHALRDGLPVLPVFILDDNIIKTLQDPSDARITFIHDEIFRLKNQLELNGSSLCVVYGKPAEIFQKLAKEYTIRAVYANHDYEPYARDRDTSVEELLRDLNIEFLTYKDQVIFEKNEVLKDSGKPYTVFTPYSRKWKDLFQRIRLQSYPSEQLAGHFIKTSPFSLPELESFGFNRGVRMIPPREIDREVIRNYDLFRDFPGISGTSRLSVHLRFGTISIRRLVMTAAELNGVYLNELIWREFYMMILWHFPHVAHSSFKKDYDRIVWRNNEDEFAAWCQGKTGYPLVDAGMRQLNHTGYMHNRTRMVTASFLTKHLLIDWRWGEAYFAEKLMDYELSSNNGGWQWAAGTGCDAAPYFRVFNPELQAVKFDPEKKYINQWVPELNTPKYPHKIVEHAAARKTAIEAYKSALQK